MIELVSLNASVHITSYLIYHVLHSMNNYKAKKKGDPQSEETKETSEPDTDT